MRGWGMLWREHEEHVSQSIVIGTESQIPNMVQWVKSDCSSTGCCGGVVSIPCQTQWVKVSSIAKAAI